MEKLFAMNSLASVVIITKNQRTFLMRSLPMLFAQQGVGDVDVVVVDSGSTDGACEYILTTPARLVCIPPESFGYARAYNIGMRAARSGSRFLVRLSGDAVPARTDWLANLLASFANDPKVAAVWGPQIAPPTLRNPMEAYINAVYYPPSRPRRRFRRAVTVNGANLAVRREFWEAHPFDEMLPQAEDFAWLGHWTRQGKQVVYTPDAPVVHGHDEPLGATLRRSLSQSALMWRMRLFPSHRRFLCWKTTAGADVAVPLARNGFAKLVCARLPRDQKKF